MTSDQLAAHVDNHVSISVLVGGVYEGFKSRLGAQSLFEQVLQSLSTRLGSYSSALDWDSVHSSSALTGFRSLQVLDRVPQPARYRYDSFATWAARAQDEAFPAPLYESDSDDGDWGW